MDYSVLFTKVNRPIYVVLTGEAGERVINGKLVSRFDNIWCYEQQGERVLTSNELRMIADELDKLNSEDNDDDC